MLPPYFYRQSLGYGGLAYDEYASEEDDYDLIVKTGLEKCVLPPFDIIEEWRKKLTRLMRNEGQLELVSRDGKDWRYFAHLSSLAARMGLYGRQYSKVIAFSKGPLPNYRSDVDEECPQSEVVLSSGLRSREETYVKAYLSRKAKNKEAFGNIALPRLKSFLLMMMFQTVRSPYTKCCY